MSDYIYRKAIQLRVDSAFKQKYGIKNVGDFVEKFAFAEDEKSKKYFRKFTDKKENFFDYYSGQKYEYIEYVYHEEWNIHFDEFGNVYRLTDESFINMRKLFCEVFGFQEKDISNLYYIEYCHYNASEGSDYYENFVYDSDKYRTSYFLIIDDEVKGVDSELEPLLRILKEINFYFSIDGYCVFNGPDIDIVKHMEYNEGLYSFIPNTKVCYDGETYSINIKIIDIKYIWKYIAGGEDWAILLAEWLSAHDNLIDLKFNHSDDELIKELNHKEYSLDVESKVYLSMYLKLTAKLVNEIVEYKKTFGLKDNKVCAYYSDIDDFCNDWRTHCGYSREESEKLLKKHEGEFMVLSDEQGIIRFAL